MSSTLSNNTNNRVELEKDRLKRKTKAVSQQLTPLKIYLLTYNILSALLWLNLLLLTFSSLLTPPPQMIHLNSLLSRFFPSSSNSFSFIDRLRHTYDHRHLGWYTKWTQTLAVMEVIHSGFGWVRSPFRTVVMQTASRLWTVWAVVEARPETHNNPLFGSMLFAWSVTEVIRYSFYALSVLGIELHWLNYLRYTSFIPLYPLGAISEAFLSFYTLPPLSTLPYLPSSPFALTLSPLSKLLQHLPKSFGKALLRSEFGRAMLWRMAQAGIKSKARVQAEWSVTELARLVMFCIWWPSLYVLYTHMFSQRRRVLGRGRQVGLKSKTT